MFKEQVPVVSSVIFSMRRRLACCGALFPCQHPHFPSTTLPAPTPFSCLPLPSSPASRYPLPLYKPAVANTTHLPHSFFLSPENPKTDACVLYIHSSPVMTKYDLQTLLAAKTNAHIDLGRFSDQAFNSKIRLCHRQRRY